MLMKLTPDVLGGKRVQCEFFEKMKRDVDTIWYPIYVSKITFDCFVNINLQSQRLINVFYLTVLH